MNSILSWLIAKQLRPVLVNWKTTLLGLIVLLPNLHEILNNLGGILQMLAGVADGQTLDVDHLKTLGAALGAGIGLLFARDGNKSSEDNGVNHATPAGKLKLPVA